MTSEWRENRVGDGSSSSGSSSSSSNSSCFGKTTGIQRKRISTLYTNALKAKPVNYSDHKSHVYNIESYRDYTFNISAIASGGFSEVYEGLVNRTNEKRIKKTFRYERVVPEDIQKEILFLSNLKGGTNIIDLCAIIKQPNDYCISLIFEYVSTCFKDVYLSFNESDSQFYLRELLRALDYCHSMAVIHRDVKPSNIMIDQETRKLKLIDFGLADFYRPKHAYKMSGSMNYLAPEELIGYKYIDYSVDMWAFGCILAEIVYNKSPFFDGFDENTQIDRITNVLGTEELKCFISTYKIRKTIVVDKEPKPWEHDSPSKHLAVDLISKIAVYDPDKRLHANQALLHGFL